MAEYRLIGTDESEGVRRGDLFIPNSTDNKHWREYLRWKAKGNTPDARYYKAEALQIMITKINQKNSYENKKKTYAYDLRGTVYNFVVDWETLSTIRGDCLTHIVLGGSLTDPVPAPDGRWKTNDKQPDGILPVYVDMTVGEFLTMVRAMSNRGVDNFRVKEFHKNNIKAMVLNTGKSSSDILNYDYSGGWH